MDTNQAEMKANQAKIHVNLREMRAGQELLKKKCWSSQMPIMKG
jgi:hypothetical protein